MRLDGHLCAVHAVADMLRRVRLSYLRLAGHFCALHAVTDTLRSVCLTYLRLDAHFRGVHALADMLRSVCLTYLCLTGVYDIDIKEKGTHGEVTITGMTRASPTSPYKIRPAPRHSIVSVQSLLYA